MKRLPEGSRRMQRPNWALSLASANRFLCFGCAAGRDFRNIGFGRADAQALAQLCVDFGIDIPVLFEKCAGILAPLADTLTAIAVPRPGFLDDVVRDGQVEHVALAADAFAVEDVKLSLAERRSDFVFDDLDLGAGADDLVALLHGGNAADIDAHRRVELERSAASRGFGVAE